MKRWIYFVYGALCYLLFLAVYAYFCAFTANLFVAKSIDAPPSSPTGAALAVNVTLLLAFGASHSVMARPGFKRQWTRLVPQEIERSTYVLVSCLMLGLLFWQWRPMPAVIWDITGPVGKSAMWTLFAAGWLMVPAVTLMISHFDLFGLRQVWFHLRGRAYESLPFRTPMMYAQVRHPLYIGWAIAFWATPRMTVGHLLLAIVLTGYMGLATIVEERDLITHFGEQYLRYRQAVPRFVPRLRSVRNRGLSASQGPISAGGQPNSAPSQT